MKFVHLSDLHLGKRVNEFSMLEDQAYILKQILELIRKERPDAVLLAGDIYDKAVPSAEAVQLTPEAVTRKVYRVPLASPKTWTVPEAPSAAAAR